MERIEVSTVVYLPPEEVYEFLVDFPRYANYSEHLESVQREGDGSPGTEYYITFSWWKLSYTARARVTDTSRPSRIEWSVVRDLDADGFWSIEPDVETTEEAQGEDAAVERTDGEEEADDGGGISIDVIDQERASDGAGGEAAGGETATDPDRPATRVRFGVEFHPESADPTRLDLPRPVSLDYVIEKVKPVVQREVERVVRRIVADLEGESRTVDVEIHATPSDL